MSGIITAGPKATKQAELELAKGAGICKQLAT